MLRIIGMIVLALLTGCASMKKDAGFEVEATRIEQGDQGGVRPPWRCVSVRDSVTEAFSYTVAIIPLPKPRPEVWNNEIDDPNLSYKVGSSARAFNCSVWRVAYYAGGRVDVYDAVMNQDRTLLYALLPPGRVAEYNQGNWLLWFRDGQTVMTMRGEVIAVEGSVAGLSNQFFALHPSPFPRYANLRRDDPEGRKFFESLEKRYPVVLTLGDNGVFSTQSDIVHVGTLTKGVNKSDRLVTCGSASAVPSVIGMTVSAVFSLPHNLSVIANGCGKKGGAVKEVIQVGLLPSNPSPNPERSPP